MGFAKTRAAAVAAAVLATAILLVRTVDAHASLVIPASRCGAVHNCAGGRPAFAVHGLPPPFAFPPTPAAGCAVSQLSCSPAGWLALLCTLGRGAPRRRPLTHPASALSLTLRRSWQAYTIAPQAERYYCPHCGQGQGGEPGLVRGPLG